MGRSFYCNPEYEHLLGTCFGGWMEGGWSAKAVLTLVPVLLTMPLEVGLDPVHETPRSLDPSQGTRGA